MFFNAFEMQHIKEFNYFIMRSYYFKFQAEEFYLMSTKTLLIALTHSAYASGESAAAMRLKNNKLISINLKKIKKRLKYLLKVCNIHIMIEFQ